MGESRVEDVATAPDVVIDLRDPETPRTEESPARRPRRAGLALLVALNALNVVDAVLTHTLTSSGIAREGNPVVGWMTLPGKVVFVAALSLALWRLRPRALVVPVVGYGALILYTLAGAALAA